jgi:hypothetical protein
MKRSQTGFELEFHDSKNIHWLEAKPSEFRSCAQKLMRGWAEARRQINEVNLGPFLGVENATGQP